MFHFVGTTKVDSYYRTDLPVAACIEAELQAKRIGLECINTPEVLNGSLLVVSLVDHPRLAPFIWMAMRVGLRVIYDYAQPVLDTPGWNSEAMRRSMELAYAVTTADDESYKQVLMLNKRVRSRGLWQDPVEPVEAKVLFGTRAQEGLEYANKVDADAVLLEGYRSIRERRGMLAFKVGLEPAGDKQQVLEYAAAGIPSVVQADTPACDFINHGHNGYIARTPETWTRYMKRYMEDADLAVKHGANAQRMAVQREFPVPLYKHWANKPAERWGAYKRLYEQQQKAI